MAGMWVGPGSSSRFAARPLAAPTSVPPYLRTSVPPHLRTSAPPHLRTSVPPHLRTSAPPHLRTSAPPYLRTSVPPSRASHAFLTAARSCASSRLRVGREQGDSSHLGVPSSGMAFLPASMRSQHLLRRNLNLHLWIPQPIPATIKKPNCTGAIRQKGIRLLSEGELCHQYQHLACKVAS